MIKKLPIFYSALMLTGVNLLLRFVSTTFQVYITGLIGAAGVGLMQLVLSVGSLALTAGVAGIRTATMYLTAGEVGKRRPQNVVWVLSGCFIYSIVCSGAVALLLYCFSGKIAALWLGVPAAADAVRMLAGFLPVSCLCGVMVGYFTAANRIGTLAAVEVAEQACSMGVTLLFLRFWAGDDSVRACQSVVLGSGFGSMLTLICLLILRIKEHAPKGPRIPVRQSLLQAAVPLALADVLKSGISTTENLMVPKRLRYYPGTEDPLALFGTVCGMVFPLMMFPACILFGLAELLIPELARCSAAGSKRRIGYLVRRSLRISMLYGGIFGGLLYLLATPLCVRLYKSSLAADWLRWYAVLVPMLYCDIITDAINKGLGQQKVSVRYNILTAAMDVTFLFLLLPKYGMSGYFFSFAVTHILNFLLSLGLLIRTTQQRFSFVPVLVTCAAGVCSILIVHRLDPGIAAGAFCAVFTCLLVLTGVLRSEDIRWVQGLIRKNKH